MTAERSEPPRPRRYLLRRAFAWVVTTFRWFIIVGWVVAAGAVYMLLPPLSAATNAADLSPFVPEHSQAVATEQHAAAEFGQPLLSRTAIVQRDADGLSRKTQKGTVEAALRFHKHPPPSLDGIAAALPIVNTGGVLPATREASTTAVTYLAFERGLTIEEEVGLAHAYAQQYLSKLPDHGSVVGVTGPSAGRSQQNEILVGKLSLVEIVAVVVVAVLVAAQFRSLLAPLVTLACAAVAYEITVRLVAWGGQHYGIPVPTELEPLIVVLLLGVVTDYTVFFLSGTRHRLAVGDDRVHAVRRATVINAPWVLGAGIAVAAGTAVLLVASLDIFHALGPGMAVTVLVSLAVSLTMAPALLAVLGGVAFYPGGPRRAGHVDDRREESPGGGWRARVLGVVAKRPVAAVIVVVIVGGLVVAGWQVTRATIGLSFIQGLPSSAEAQRAANAAAKGFAPGIVAPSSVVVDGKGLAKQQGALARLGESLRKQPGVAGVIGPAMGPTARSSGVFLAPDGNAARYALVFDSPPVGATAIHHVDALKSSLPALARQAGLRNVDTGIAGDTAIASEIVDTTTGDIWRVLVAAFVVDLLVLLLFLRAPVASLYLLVADVLSLAAALGITTVVSTHFLGYPQYTFYVPLAAIVLLVSFGSDYNIFLVGRIWDAAGTRSTRDAIVSAAPRASRAITIAGLSLAASFATLALIPLVPLREFALAMVVGVLLEIAVVRPLLVPALISLFGRVGTWPRRR